MSEAETEARGLPPATGAFLAIIVVVYVLLAFSSGDLDITPEVILTWGGIVPLKWLDGQYWRLLAAGFLHFSLMHIMANTICLLAWGVPLERLMGSLRLLILLLGSIITGSLASVLMHQEVFVGAGASGGTSGLLGSLFLLWALRVITIPASFFAINIGLNVAITLFVPGIDWQAHLGGFLGGAGLAGLMVFWAKARSAGR
jgi:membrane associated rhomboid family serine protease